MKLAALTAAAVAALTLTASAGAHLIRPGCNSHLRPRVELACAIANRDHAQATLEWARKFQRHGRLASFRAADRLKLGEVVRGHRWLYRTMTARIGEARRRIAAASWPAHHLLWLCIHSGEGAWNDRDSGGNGHYGGLQMHPGWGYGTSYYASDDSQLVQEQSAERAYRASGYSRSWLYGQWAADARCF